MYKRPKIFGKVFPFYASPPSQLVIVALVCFLCPGMFNAINGLGAGGQLDAHDVNNANVAVYATFSIVGFFAGSVANRIGLRLTLSFGGFGYFIYTASILCYNHTQNAGFLIFAGALLGACAGLLWCAQGAVMMSYPPEASKGRYISWFWMIFNLGAVIGGLIPLGQNLHSTANKVNDGTYIGFMVLMFLGAVLAWTLCNSGRVERADGSHVILIKNPSWRTEIWGLWEVIRSDTYIIFYFPMFFASNWFYAYHFNDVNLAKFNIRTRALNSVLYYLSQILGAYVFGYALDIKRLSRPFKARAAWGVMFVLTFVIWGGGYDWQKQYTREEVTADDYVKIDFQDGGSYIAPMFLYMFYGFYDASFQTTCYWLMGSLTNNSRKLANFAGFYKGIQSAGNAAASSIDAGNASYMSEFATNWGLLSGSLLIAAPVIFTKIRETIPVDEDLKFSDETIEEVAGTEKLNAIHTPHGAEKNTDQGMAPEVAH